ncbi:hypothetical protein ACQEVS_00080 [Streptomyces sp. CA-181903]|uniref:oxidoreductase n=1 Tax=Streptomyces sp. CA-181903 TaxID=3240055 RepID=UPI003D8DA4CA
MTEAVMNGLPPRIAQVLCGHRRLDATMGYKTICPAETIKAHRAFIDRHRASRPSEESRTPTEEEWDAFLAHFEKRKVSIGNERTDQYGGAVTNRIRFAVEVASAVADEIGAARTGLRVSPGNSYNDRTEHDTHQVYPALLAALAALNLAYLHMIHAGDEDLVVGLRREWPAVLLLNRARAPLRAGSPTSMSGRPTSSPSRRPLWPTRTCRPASRRTRR